MLTTALTSGGLLLASPVVAQTAGCTSVNGTCTFSDGSSEQGSYSAVPFVYSSTGSAGSGSTDGGTGGGGSFVYDSPVVVQLPLSSGAAYPYATAIESAGGAGSTGGPSAGGAGGNLNINAGANSAILDITEYFSTIGNIQARLVTSTGGNGNDNNTNDKSNGGAGGAGGDITYTGNSQGSSVSTSLTGTSGPGVISATFLQSSGGQGGRGNEGATFTPYGGAGGAGGNVTVNGAGPQYVGSSDYPVVAGSVFGLAAFSFGGSGPDDFNSAANETQGGGGASTGGQGGTVAVTMEENDNVFVYGQSTAGEMRGVYARSQGGNGGWSYNVGVDKDFTDGGNGGAGGAASVTLNASAAVVQSGTAVSDNQSAAVVAMSIGGEGGVGQSGTTGGSGGAGGAATVTVTSEPLGIGGEAILGSGTGVDGIWAYTRGGTGGDGLDNANSSTGGVGGNGGTVAVTVDLQSDQSIVAEASSAGSDSGRGIAAQSIGYFGGEGSDGNAVFGSPGSAGGGGNGGAVTVRMNSGNISTDGTNDAGSGLNFAHGILAQSIGGGGGDGGDFQGLFGGEGGAGGKGGNGADVTVVNAAPIATKGTQANGILAQSIGGGGGSGGVSSAALVALGGNGGSSGTSGTVSVTNSGAISTLGYGASGILAQSIVGAGGAAGVSSGAVSIGGTGGSASTQAPGTLTATNTGSIVTAGNAAIGLHAQSIGGGGGSASGGDGSDQSSGIYTLGTKGGGGGAGGAVTIADVGTITTAGNYGYGVLAHSIGGGGGNGGDAFSASILGTVTAAVGGQAGGGGNGGAVTVKNTVPFAVSTAGQAATGIYAQSVGGGGGTGGDASTKALVTLVQIGIGGDGGDAGNGGNVAVALDGGSITTAGTQAGGVKVQSVGGGGGSGGNASSSSAGVVSLGFAVGGFADGGGNGGTASAALTDATISTATSAAGTNDAIGVLIQSIGGGGGTGGAATASAITTGVPVDPEDPDVTLSLNAQFALGGAGGDGGNGAAASATVADGSTVTTNGAGSHGVLVQSIGGGGGSGGDASTATTTFPDSTDTYTLTINAAMGGSGGDGGAGGAASATVGSSSGTAASPTTIATKGAYANAVVVQSIGGGGGNSGTPTSVTNQLRGAGKFNVTMDVGAANILSSELGADGGAASVTLYEDAVLTTTGDGSRAVVAQSIGGGGGTLQGGELSLGGTVNTDADEEKGSYTGAVTVGLGGTGGQGGAGGAVTVDMNGASIVTAGLDADGVLAQSIGGGGGLAGSVGSSSNTADDDSSGISDDDDDDIDVTLTTSVGGSGGTGGTGGAVAVNYRGSTATSGSWADGVVAQSIGGGGGTGGTALSSSTGETGQVDISVGGSGGSGGNAGAVSVTYNDNAPGAFIDTAGYMAHGTLAQSIGGGGGQGGDGSDSASGTLSVGGSDGGSGGASGNGGSVSLSGYINTSTQGDDAHAVVAQSIGGGGGIAGSGTSDTADGGDDSYSIDLSVGGSGGSGGAGGMVTISVGTDMNTYGERAFGIVAQSIGGGGGIGGAGNADNLASVNLGGSGGGGGDGGAVSVTLTSGSVSTRGTGAHAVIAQSIGGGGGLAGAAGSGPLSLISRAGGASGNGGAVTVVSDAAITTSGNYAYGILAQSIGGGGGFGGDADGTFAGANSGGSGTAGTVTVTTNSTVSATGAGAIGILAQSDAPSGAGDITIAVNADITGGSGSDGYAVYAAGGSVNQLLVQSGVSITPGSGGYAVGYSSNLAQSTAPAANAASLATAPGLIIRNAGTLRGSVRGQRVDGAETVTVRNLRRGLLVDAGRYAANVNNRGRLVIGDGTDETRQLTIRGNFSQTGAGTTETVADFQGGRASAINVKGNADLAGTLKVDASTIYRGRTATLMTVSGAITGTIEAMDTPAVDYETTTRGGTVRIGVAGTRFGSAFDQLTPNQSTAGGHLDALFAARAGRYAAVLAEYNRLSQLGDDGAAYAAAVNALSPGGSQAAAAAQAVLTQSRLNKALSCPHFQGDNALVSEGTCTWGGLAASSIDQGGQGGYDGTLWGFAAGAQVEVQPNWYLGFAGGYESSDFGSADGLSSADGDTVFASLALKRQLGGFLLSGAISGSYGWYDVDRTVAGPGFSAKATADSDIYTLGARARVSYTAASEVAYVRPFLDLDAVYANSSAYTERGAGLFNLSVSGQEQTAFVATPAVEIGARLKAFGEWDARLYATAGISLSTEDDWKTDARLVSAPLNAGTFQTTLPVADVFARVGAGMQISNTSGFDVRADYEGAFGNDFSSHSGTLRLVKRF
ncbi:autotransporter outer membrane beta-barrel domain-containing protein [Acuticoccus sp. MNP-M23]|uniref:autotransporter outer membrane beta-barrel domain-containing protein n=1 Tax=Acuticoccus sp. MNP-M23 TaxID=3072793 RepID=UPI002814C8E8|nr:autotransporter outer membrane beta-barrel domain-containing protein [Acuticoccus sp. MNP-M23]WMS44648.1 autotransporter outer membrane beta-barrel domain-containing protein [Acuticoccus sp. MNP-M23]